MKKRYILEGEWTGYSSSQRHVVHRAVISSLKLVEWVKKNGAIQFTDGTSLVLSVRLALKREKVALIPGYRSLIDDCVHYDVRSVSALNRKEQERKAAVNDPSNGRSDLGKNQPSRA